MAFAPPTDGPPPSPALDPAAAQEAGMPASAVAGLTAGSALTSAPAGPDVSGILALGQKLVEGMLALAQAAPMIGPDMDQAQSIVMNALGKFSSGATGTGTSSTSPLTTTPQQPPAQTQAPPPKGAVVSQAGPQFPGALTGNSRPF